MTSSDRERLDEAFRQVFEPTKPTPEELAKHLETVLAPRERKQMDLLPGKVPA